MNRTVINPLASRLRRIVLRTCGIALFAASLVFISADFMAYKNLMVERSSELADFIATNVTAALVFNDQKTAEQLLRALKSRSDINFAAIYDKKNVEFARYGKINDTNRINKNWVLGALKQNTATNQFTSNVLTLVHPIWLDSEIVGHVVIETGLAPLMNRVTQIVVMVALIWFSIMIVIYLLAFSLHRQISAPIERLVRSMETVSSQGRYDISIDPGENDEIGVLIDGFNNMIKQVRERNERLAETHKEIEQQAYFDSLTKLPNRRMLLKLLEQELGRIGRYDNYGVLMFLDLDRFKLINDSLGHNTGDQLLREVSERILRGLRAGDTAARFGGDEFIILVPDIADDLNIATSNAFLVAEKIRTIIEQPVTLQDNTFYTTASIGITLFSKQNIHTESILKQADMALYRAKDKGRNTIEFYSSDMQKVANERLILENEIRNALLCDQFILYYQPQTDETGKITGVEALIRWQHPKKGLVPPGQFIETAEITGLILPIGVRVLTMACTQMSAWVKSGLMKNACISVNVSPHEIRQAGFSDQVRDILASTGLDGDHLELEITEGVLLDRSEDVILTMKKLHKMGVKLAIDDFGTGYSSLGYLQNLPLDKLKIDQSFVKNLPDKGDSEAIVDTIIAIARHFDMRLIAEGVEEQAQLECLQQHGCHYFQGYLMGKPMPAEQFQSLFESQPESSLVLIRNSNTENKR